MWYGPTRISPSHRPTRRPSQTALCPPDAPIWCSPSGVQGPPDALPPCMGPPVGIGGGREGRYLAGVLSGESAQSLLSQRSAERRWAAGGLPQGARRGGPTEGPLLGPFWGARGPKWGVGGGVRGQLAWLVRARAWPVCRHVSQSRGGSKAARCCARQLRKRERARDRGSTWHSHTGWMSMRLGCKSQATRLLQMRELSTLHHQPPRLADTLRAGRSTRRLIRLRGGWLQVRVVWVLVYASGGCGLL